ncbi:MAG: hypothetical protein QOG75_4684 [Mycobacterium sp.]|jgi:NAD(P)H-dependent flavin oxidoreductase YrpB (nitropropane dioxygenase family)|nr:hypothetical protein [Mycobacterium sp.]
MGPDITGPDLVAAVSNAGGLGLALHSQNTTTPMTNRSTTTNPSARFSGTQPTNRRDTHTTAAITPGAATKSICHCDAFSG